MSGERARSRAKVAGVASALLACAIWGASFLAPQALAGRDAQTIAFSRFVFFGFCSALALIARRRVLPRPTRRQLGEGAVLALAGYSVYYVCLAVGVQNAGAPFATAIVGLLPLTILAASTPKREWSRFFWPGLLLAGGALLVPAELFGEAYGALLERTLVERAIGLASSVAALGLWTFFAIRNAEFLKRNREWNALDWSSVLGVLAGSASVGGAVLTGKIGEISSSLVSDRPLVFWAAFMGVVGAWFATALWNRASRALSAAVVGQLLVFESVFGLLYAFVYDGRWPRPLETLAIAALLGGAVLAMRKLRQAER